MPIYTPPECVVSITPRLRFVNDFFVMCYTFPMDTNLARLMIKDHESLRLTVYDDATGKPLRKGDTLEGHPTIGYGRNLSGLGISLAESDMLLEHDIQRVVGELIASLPFFTRLSTVRKSVLIDMCYNIGIKRLLNFARMISAIEVHDYKTAAREIVDSKYAKQVGRRAQTLSQMMRDDKISRDLHDR